MNCKDIYQSLLEILGIDFWKLDVTTRCEIDWKAAEIDDILEDENNESYADGREAGFEEGLSEGYDNGWNDAMESQD